MRGGGGGFRDARIAGVRGDFLKSDASARSIGALEGDYRSAAFFACRAIQGVPLQFSHRVFSK